MNPTSQVKLLKPFLQKFIESCDCKTTRIAVTVRKSIRGVSYLKDTTKYRGT